jgi:hypothetical protein
MGSDGALDKNVRRYRNSDACLCAAQVPRARVGTSVYTNLSRPRLRPWFSVRSEGFMTPEDRLVE